MKLRAKLFLIYWLIYTASAITFASIATMLTIMGFADLLAFVAGVAGSSILMGLGFYLGFKSGLEW